MSPTNPSAGELLARSGRELRAADRPAFEATTAALARLLVAGGLDASEDPIAVRVDRTTNRLRTTLVAAVLSPADARAKSAVDAIALACANLDARIARYGPPPDPYAATADKPRRRRS